MKALNVFGIIIAWLLSIALVVVLIASPLLFSTLSMLEPKNIVKVVTGSLVEASESASANPQQEYALQKLSSSSDVESLAESLLKDLDLEEVAGQKIDEEVVLHVLASDAMADVVEAYANDITNALTGESDEREFTAKNLKNMVIDNLDEIVEAVEDAGVSLSKSEEKEVKEKIKSSVKKNADKIVDSVPDPEEIVETVVDNGPLGDFLSKFLSQVDTLKATLLGVIVVLSLLIFFLRLPGFRGLRWLASDLLVAGVVNVLFCLGVRMSASAAMELAGDADGSAVEGIVTKFIDMLSTNLIVRTVVMFVAAAALLVVYYVLKSIRRKKKAAKKAAPVMAAPAFVPALAPVVVPAPAAEPVEEPIAEPEVPASEETAEAPAAEETVEAPAVEETVEAPAAEETAEAPAAEETAEAPAEEL